LAELAIAIVASPFARYSSSSPTVATVLLSIDPAIAGALAISSFAACA